MDYQDLRYKRKIQSLEEDPELEIVTRLVGDWGKAVLELGCHDGSLSKFIKDRGGEVTGVDINPIAAAKAKEFCERIVVGDLESEKILECISSKKYDIILALHLLEHLKDPWSFLQRVGDLLNEEGKLIIALPNIGNLHHRVRLFQGEFNYEETGVMDRTHLRFFNLRTAIEMIEGSGLRVQAVKFSGKIDGSFELAQIFPSGTKTAMRKLLSAWKKFEPSEIHKVMIFQCTQVNHA